MNRLPSADELIKAYDLKPHPEGGFYKETYRSEGIIASPPAPFPGPRRFSTAIYFLLPPGAKSRLHRILSDEMWHFYLGGPLAVVQISPDGKEETVMLGQDIQGSQKLQHVVPAGCWFGSYPSDPKAYSFVGCTVAPGFEFADFELGKRESLLKLFPGSRKTIEHLTD